MKKILLSLIIIGTGLAVSAQTKPFKIGIKAGVTLPKFSISGNDNGKIASNTSFYVGGNVDFALSSIFSIQPGLTLSGKGSKLEYRESNSGNSYSDDYSTGLMYVEIPINAVASFPVGSGKIFVGAGPYYGIAISGKDKHKYTETVDGKTVSESESENIQFGDEGDYKRRDFGVNFLGGYQLSNGFNVHAGYGLGLSNISSGTGAKTKNAVLSVGVGFSF